MVRLFWVFTLLVCFVSCGALLMSCTATQQQEALDAAKKVCVVIDHVPSGSQMYVFVRPIADGGAE